MLATTLNERERRFCEEYLTDYNATRAARAAGYSESTASHESSEILRRPEAQEYISHLKGEQTIRTKVNADYVLNAIVETLERCRQEVKPVHTPSGAVLVVQDAEGNPANAFKFDAKNVLKAAELLGKHLAMFTDVTDNRVTFTQIPDVKLVPSGEGGQMIEAQAKELTFDVGSEPNKPKSFS